MGVPGKDGGSMVGTVWAVSLAPSPWETIMHTGDNCLSLCPPLTSDTRVSMLLALVPLERMEAQENPFCVLQTKKYADVIIPRGVDNMGKGLSTPVPFPSQSKDQYSLPQGCLVFTQRTGSVYTLQTYSELGCGAVHPESQQRGRLRQKD